MYTWITGTIHIHFTTICCSLVTKGSITQSLYDERFSFSTFNGKLKAYIESCHICQERKAPTKDKVGKPFSRDFSNSTGDEGKAFASNVLQHILKRLKIDSTYTWPYNQGRLLAERSIQSIWKLLINHLSGNGKNWPTFVAAVIYAYNTF